MSAAEATDEFVPSFVGQIELGEPIRALETSAHYGRARLLVRLDGTPLGIINVPLNHGAATGEQLSAAVAEQLEEISPRPAPEIDTQQLVSVVLCTRDHPVELARAVASVLACEYPRLELIVVDNAPSTDATRELLERISDDRLRYALEPIAGLSRARNRGLVEANGEIIAFTDDDVEVDAGWIHGLLEGFMLGGHVGLVTGVIPMGALENEFQQYFDDRVQWSDNFQPRLYDLTTNRLDRPLYPYTAGVFGTGANFAIRAVAAEAIGRFDEALGAGAPTRGGEDLDYFVRTLHCDGWQIAYEPRALVWHYHRADAASLGQQMYGYGTGLAAFAVKTAIQPRHFFRLCRMTAALFRQRLVGHEASPGVDSGHGELKKLRRKGLIFGPFLYIKAWRIARGNPPLT